MERNDGHGAGEEKGLGARSLRRDAPVLGDISPVGDRPEQLGTGDLIREFGAELKLLLQKELALGKTELGTLAQREKGRVAGLGASALLGLFGIGILLLAAVFGLALVMPLWASCLIVGGALVVLAAIAAAFGWSSRPGRPFEATRRTLKQDVRWTREKLS